MSKKRKRGKRKFTIPIAPIAGLLAGIAGPTAYGPSILERVIQGDYVDAARLAALQYTGLNVYTGAWTPMEARGTIALIIGALVHKFVGGAPLNLNRMLASANVPIIRI